MPFDAAKAVAATFCYHIRYALTPLFGVDFLSRCVKPEEPSFGRMVIDSKIVQQCTITARAFRALSSVASHASTPSIRSSNSVGTWSTKSLRTDLGSPADNESAYETDTDRSDQFPRSPRTPPTTQWTALNTPVSSTRIKSGTSSARKGCTSKSIVRYEKSSSSDGVGNGKRDSRGGNDDSDQESSSSQSSIELQKGSERRRVSSIATQEARAAYMLMQMQMADATLVDSPYSPKSQQPS